MIRQLEVCVDTMQGALNAAKGGAHRIELCAALSEGGLTPSVGLMQNAAQLDVPVYAMIRPRSGNFMFSKSEEQIMHIDVAAARDAGLAGVVLGAQKSDATLDSATLKCLVQTAQGMGLTLHRVIDSVKDPIDALDQAIALGFERVLTSGAAHKAVNGTNLIAKMVAHAQGRIKIMPGSGVTPDNARDIITKTGVTELHASCARQIIEPAFFDFAPSGGRKETSAETVQALVQAIQY